MWRESCWLFGIKQSFASYFKSEIENWPNIFQAISYWFNIFSGKHPCQKNKSNNQNYGWLMAGWLASQCMHCIMLYDLDILTKSKQIDKKYISTNAMELLGWNLPSCSLLTVELRREVNLLKAYSEERNFVCWVRKRVDYVASTNCEAPYLGINSAYITNSGWDLGQTFECPWVTVLLKQKQKHGASLRTMFIIAFCKDSWLLNIITICYPNNISKKNEKLLLGMGKEIFFQNHIEQ